MRRRRARLFKILMFSGIMTNYTENKIDKINKKNIYSLYTKPSLIRLIKQFHQNIIIQIPLGDLQHYLIRIFILIFFFVCQRLI